MTALRSLLSIAALAASCVAAGAADEPAIAPRQRPYQVRILLAFGSDPALDARFRADARAELVTRIERVAGALWNATIEETDRIQPVNAAGLERLDALDAAELAGDAEKVFFVLVEGGGGRVAVSAREWDAASRTLSTVSVRPVWERRAVAEETISLLSRMFRPVLLIEDVQGDAVTLQLQAGDFPPGDPDLPQVRAGDVLAPILKHFDRSGEVRQLQPLPWTYLVVEKVEGPTVTARIETGVRTPLGAKRRRNLEMMAVGVRPLRESTRLTLIPRARPDRPLAGHQVIASPERPIEFVAEGDEKGAAEKAAREAASTRHLTSRAGTVTIPRTPAHPLSWLSIYSGEALLARIPYVAGVESTATVELPDDSLRLTVEGELDILKGRLVDTVARRAVLISRARTMARASEWKSVGTLMTEIEALPGVAAFEREVSAIRLPAIESAQSRKDRTAELRIKQLSDDTLQLIRRYLDNDKLSELKEEIRELQRLDKAGDGAPKAGGLK